MTPDRAAASVVVFGAGATGARIVRMLAASPCVGSVEVRETDSDRLREVADSFDDVVTFGEGMEVPDSTDLVVVATAAGTQTAAARSALRAGAGVVTTTNEIIETRDLLALDQQAKKCEVPLVVGAGFMPGLTCLMARVGAAEFDLGRRDPCRQGWHGGTGLRAPASPCP